MLFFTVWIGSLLIGLGFVLRAWRGKNAEFGARVVWLLIGAITLGCFYFLTVDLAPKYVRLG